MKGDDKGVGAEKTCQECRRRKTTTQRRQIYLKNYVGPCGDSFCYASCDSSACREVSLSLCDECKVKLSKS